MFMILSIIHSLSAILHYMVHSVDFFFNVLVSVIMFLFIQPIIAFLAVEVVAEYKNSQGHGEKNIQG